MPQNKRTRAEYDEYRRTHFRGIPHEEIAKRFVALWEGREWTQEEYDAEHPKDMPGVQRMLEIFGATNWRSLLTQFGLSLKKTRKRPALKEQKHNLVIASKSPFMDALRSLDASRK